MSDGVDAAMDSPQSPRAHAPIDVLVRQPRIDELRPGHHTVLVVRKRGDHVVRDAFSSHIDE
jgi:hypothetical protein